MDEQSYTVTLKCCKKNQSVVLTDQERQALIFGPVVKRVTCAACKKSLNLTFKKNGNETKISQEVLP